MVGKQLAHRTVRLAFRSVRQMPNDCAVDLFVDDNPFGVLDHYVTLNNGTEIYVPMRVIATPTRGFTQVQITIFPTAEMTREAFAADLDLVRGDLARLKQILEREG